GELVFCCHGVIFSCWGWEGLHRFPDSPFVSPGDTVEVGQTVGMVEIMKQFNEIKSEVSGTVESVEVENAAPVTPGMVLVKVSEG
ncbi:acetyl-CoA carboxylase biotin carboxyl carrier protein, partial [Rothia nasimurium]|uniref:acetyl-CoA carboxylase biotin carboxyl carrier protein n=1 Tax=Rothia nasimurium TaxID=85336 RepID=UPI00361ADABF